MRNLSRAVMTVASVTFAFAFAAAAIVFYLSTYRVAAPATTAPTVASNAAQATTPSSAFSAPKDYALRSPDGRWVISGDDATDVRERETVHFATFRDLKTGAVKSYPISSSVIGRGGPGLLPSYDETMDSFRLVPVGWSVDGSHALFTVYAGPAYEIFAKYGVRTARLGDGLIAVDPRDGSFKKMTDAPLFDRLVLEGKGMYVVTEGSESVSGGFPRRSVVVSELSDSGEYAAQVAKVTIGGKGAFLSNAVLSDGAKYLGYVAGLPDVISDTGLPSGYGFEMHLLDLSSGIDYPIGSLGGEDRPGRFALSGDYVEVNHWYFDTVMRSLLESGGESIDLRLEPGKIADVLAKPAAGSVCSKLGIFCLDGKLEGKTLEKGATPKVTTLAGGYYLDLQVLDGNGDRVGRGTIPVDPYFGSYGKAKESGAAIRYTAVPTSTEGELKVTAFRIGADGKPAVLDELAMPILLPKLKESDIPPEVAG